MQEESKCQIDSKKKYKMSCEGFLSSEPIDKANPPAVLERFDDWIGMISTRARNLKWPIEVERTLMVVRDALFFCYYNREAPVVTPDIFDSQTYKPLFDCMSLGDWVSNEEFHKYVDELEDAYGKGQAAYDNVKRKFIKMRADQMAKSQSDVEKGDRSSDTPQLLPCKCGEMPSLFPSIIRQRYQIVCKCGRSYISRDESTELEAIKDWNQIHGAPWRAQSIDDRFAAMQRQIDDLLRRVVEIEGSGRTSGKAPVQTYNPEYFAAKPDKGDDRLPVPAKIGGLCCCPDCTVTLRVSTSGSMCCPGCEKSFEIPARG
jgi:hypothetical protein